MPGRPCCTRDRRLRGHTSANAPRPRASWRHVTLGEAARPPCPQTTARGSRHLPEDAWSSRARPAPRLQPRAPAAWRPLHWPPAPAWPLLDPDLETEETWVTAPSLCPPRSLGTQQRPRDTPGPVWPCGRRGSTCGGEAVTGCPTDPRPRPPSGTRDVLEARLGLRVTRLLWMSCDQAAGTVLAPGEGPATGAVPPRPSWPLGQGPRWPGSAPAHPHPGEAPRTQAGHSATAALLGHPATKWPGLSLPRGA